MSTLALKGALEAAAPGLRAEFHATQALLKSIAEGESADVVILTAEGIDQLVSQSAVLADTRLELGRSGVGLAVRAGAYKPRIGSLEELKQALLAADSVGHSKQGASGLYFAGLLDKLGLAQKLKKRVIVEKGPVAARIVTGEVQLGAQLLCELAPVKGIDIIGPFPDEVQKYYSFSAAVMKSSKKPDAAKAFLAFMRTEPVRAAMKKNLIEPG
ncbi:MAG TPA: substrate-binding domain-containing protein [Burkholderiales bacterium]|nr:substrate-binding domain-containing protein [Burkholderiales bacterium]